MSAFNTKDLKTEINTIMLNKSNSPKKHGSSKKPREEEFTEPSHSDQLQRPHTLNELEQVEKLTEDINVETTFTYNKSNDDEEIWILDIPKTINPLQLKDQTLQLGNKSNIKIDEDKYCATSRETKSSFTCVFGVKNAPGKYRTVNIKPTRTISLRKKLSGISKNHQLPPYEKPETVPFPKNIKSRHPLFGVSTDKQ